MNYSYRKKPVVVQAFQMTAERRQDNRDWPEWLNRAWNFDRGEVGAFFCVDKAPLTVYDDGSDLYITTLEGPLHVSFGDWIIQGVQGEIYPCKPDIFEQTYEEA